MAEMRVQLSLKNFSERKAHHHEGHTCTHTLTHTHTYQQTHTHTHMYQVILVDLEQLLRWDGPPPMRVLDHRVVVMQVIKRVLICTYVQ